MRVKRSPKIDVLANYVFNHNKTMKPFDDLISDAREEDVISATGNESKNKLMSKTQYGTLPYDISTNEKKKKKVRLPA